MKSGESCSSGFREEYVSRFHEFMYIDQEEGQITSTVLTVAKQFYFINHTL